MRKPEKTFLDSAEWSLNTGLTPYNFSLGNIIHYKSKAALVAMTSRFSQCQVKIMSLSKCKLLLAYIMIGNCRMYEEKVRS